MLVGTLEEKISSAAPDIVTEICADPNFFIGRDRGFDSAKCQV